MAESRISRRVVDAARRAMAARDQLRLGKVLAEEIDSHQTSTADLSSLAADLGCSLRSLRYAAAVYRLVKRLRLSEVDVREIGWTKLALVASLESQVRSREDIVRLCAGRTAPELRALLAGGSGSEQQVTFTLSERQRRALEAALLLHGAKRVGRSLIGKEAALMAIVKHSKPT